jgi:hypothetical protein
MTWAAMKDWQAGINIEFAVYAAIGACVAVVTMTKLVTTFTRRDSLSVSRGNTMNLVHAVIAVLMGYKAMNVRNPVEMTLYLIIALTCVVYVIHWFKSR